jgi:hypothetical protein
VFRWLACLMLVFRWLACLSFLCFVVLLVMVSVACVYLCLLACPSYLCWRACLDCDSLSCVSCLCFVGLFVTLLLDRLSCLCLHACVGSACFWLGHVCICLLFLPFNVIKSNVMKQYLYFFQFLCHLISISWCLSLLTSSFSRR